MGKQAPVGCQPQMAASMNPFGSAFVYYLPFSSSFRGKKIDVGVWACHADTQYNPTAHVAVRILGKGGGNGAGFGGHRRWVGFNAATRHGNETSLPVALISLPNFLPALCKHITEAPLMMAAPSKSNFPVISPKAQFTQAAFPSCTRGARAASIIPQQHALGEGQ